MKAERARLVASDFDGACFTFLTTTFLFAKRKICILISFGTENHDRAQRGLIHGLCCSIESHCTYRIYESSLIK